MNRILLLLDHKENRRLLAEWLRQKYQVTSAESDQALDEPFDLGILDGPALDRLWERVQARKEAEQPLFLPFLLVTARKDVRHVTRHLWRTVDELILTPIEKVELQARVEILLRARRLSQQLHAEAIEQLRASEERYRLISEVAFDYLYAFRVEPDGTMWGEWVSDSFVRVFGYTIPEIDARGGWQSMVYPDDLPIALEHARKVISGQDDICEMRFVTRNGEVRWLRDYAKPTFDEASGRVVRIYGASQDITERKQAEEKLRESEARLNHLFAVNPAIVYALDPENSSTTWVSPNITEITGYTPEEALQPGWWAAHVHPEDWEDAKKAQERLMVEDRVAHEYRFQKKDGTYIWVRDELRLLRDEQGRPKEIVGSWMNITDRKEAEIALAKSEQRYRSVVENTGTAMLIVNEDGSIAFANQQCAATTGYSPEELQGTDWRNYVVADDLPMMENNFRLRFRDPDKAPNRYEARLIHADGSIRNALLTVGTIPSTRQVVVSIQDITERVQVEEALRQSEERYRLMLNTTLDGFILADDEGRILQVNPSYCDMIGYSEQELLSMNIRDLEARLSDQEVTERIQQMVSQGKARFETRHRAKDGHLIDLEVSISIFQSGDKPLVAAFVRDITERKRAEEELRQHRDRLVKLSRRLAEARETEQRALGRELHDQFGQMLTALKLTLEIATQLPPEATNPKIEQARQIADELLSRVRALSLELRPPMLDDLGLHAALLWLANHYEQTGGIKVAFKQRGLEGARFDTQVETAAYRIAQEALTNAARHAQATRVRLEVRVEAGRMHMEIEDDGVGFDPQAVPTYSRGLVGMRERAELLGGTFRIESHIGRGTRILVSLPVEDGS